MATITNSNLTTEQNTIISLISKFTLLQFDLKRAQEGCAYSGFSKNSIKELDRVENEMNLIREELKTKFNFKLSK
tara:strand:- start:180 stop:404 length:225 start_codon:yes stop_codon:yes gene_type:complete